MPDFFLCDNGKEFVNKVVREMLEAHGKISRTSGSSGTG